MPSPALAPARADPGRTPSETLDGEHKQVTVLCGALAEVPILTARLGPEGLYRLLQAWLALVQEVVQHYDGTLTPSAGEGFTALFGAPVAHEDHARRAVLAALDLRERCQTHLTRHASLCDSAGTMQMGLHSGLVVAGDLGTPPRRHYTAVGEATQVALHLQQHVLPGAMLISAATYALVQEEIQSAAVDALAVAGLPAPMLVYTVQGLRQRRAGVTGHGARVLSRFVGREQELALLQAGLAQVAQGQGQVIGVVGDPGMGKSRLLAEFRQSLAGQAVTYYAGHCLPYGQATPYLPVRDVVRQHCGLSATDQPEAITVTVHRCMQEAGLHPEEAAPVLLQLLDVPVADAAYTRLSPEERKAQTFRVLHQLSRSASQQQPLVLAVEDLHWIDATSEARHPIACVESYLRVGFVKEAHRLAQRALADTREHKMRGWEARALWLLGEIARHSNPPDMAPATTYYQQALALAETLGMRPLQAHCHLGLGTLYATTGQREPARTALAAAIALYCAMDMVFWLPQAEAVLAHIE